MYSDHNSAFIWISSDDGSSTFFRLYLFFFFIFFLIPGKGLVVLLKFTKMNECGRDWTCYLLFLYPKFSPKTTGTTWVLSIPLVISIYILYIRGRRRAHTKKTTTKPALNEHGSRWISFIPDPFPSPTQRHTSRVQTHKYINTGKNQGILNIYITVRTGKSQKGKSQHAKKPTIHIRGITKLTHPKHRNRGLRGFSSRPSIRWVSPRIAWTGPWQTSFISYLESE